MNSKTRDDAASAATNCYASDLRKSFESWISSPPYELSTKRLADKSAWPGQYDDINVQRAFEAWIASAEQFQSCVAVATNEGTCRAFRTADGFRRWMMENTEPRGLVLAWVDGVRLEA